MIRPVLRCGSYRVVLDRPRIMGIINVTPDSFSDGGMFPSARAAVDHGLRLVAEGADVLDVGGESTRPGSRPVSAEEELARVVPVVEKLAEVTALPISVDTSKPDVMRAALGVGASMINDVRALRTPGALELVAPLQVGVCLMHAQGEPETMQDNPHYDDVVGEVRAFLAERVAVCTEAGIARERLLVDPGFGFGKTLEHNVTLLAGLAGLDALGVPVLVGLSRKGMIGALTGGRPVHERTPGSVAAAILAVQRGAAMVRVHDVAATADAIRVLSAVEGRSRHDPESS